MDDAGTGDADISAFPENEVKGALTAGGRRAGSVVGGSKAKGGHNFAFKGGAAVRVVKVAADYNVASPEVGDGCNGCVKAGVVRGGGSVDVDGNGDDVSNGYSEELEGFIDRFGNGVENRGRLTKGAAGQDRVSDDGDSFTAVSASDTSAGGSKHTVSRKG